MDVFVKISIEIFLIYFIFIFDIFLYSIIYIYVKSKCRYFDSYEIFSTNKVLIVLLNFF